MPDLQNTRCGLLINPVAVMEMLSDRDVVLALAVVLGAQVPMEVYLEGRQHGFTEQLPPITLLWSHMTPSSSRKLNAGLNEVLDGIAIQRLKPRPHVTHKPALALMSKPMIRLFR